MVFAEAARHDFLQAASYLVLGAAAAAALHVVVPRWVFEHLAAHLILGVVVMAALAVVLALCSEADAFVAASMTMVPLLPRLVFLVVGPAVDVKLFAMQAGLFGRAFAARFAPCTLLVATASACAVGLFGSRWWISAPRNREHRFAAGGHQHRHDHGVGRVHPLRQARTAAVAGRVGGAAHRVSAIGDHRRYPPRRTADR